MTFFNFPRYEMPISALRILLFLSILSEVTFGQEHPTYKSGIDVYFEGIPDKDYAEEYFYHDKLVMDRKVVYIRSSTAIRMRHNERNIARLTGSDYAIIGENGKDSIANSGDEGQIRFRIDGDLHWGPQWTAGLGGKANLAYNQPLKFSTLRYPENAAGARMVLGSVGDNGAPIESKSSYFHYGHRDPFGDEWHSIQVADDDWSITSTDTEWRASDGKIILFVVDPKTPVLKITASGNAQFYTTPPKAYFIPKIHSQTTYFIPREGSISFSLHDIFGEKVFYRVNGGNWTEGTNPLLTSDMFPDGESTLEYYVAGKELYKKTRRIVKNPAFPSANEQHGYVVIGNSANYEAALGRTLIAPYKQHWDRLIAGTSDNGRRTEWDNVRNKGLRYVPKYSFANAFAAKIQGIDALAPGKTKSYAEYAKEMILQNGRTIDNIGFEMHHPQNTLPTRELTYRGYYDVSAVFNLAFAYDLLISFYRSDQHPSGITSVEDFYLRDCIAQDIVETLMFSSSMQSPFNLIDKGGMWDVARKCGSLAGLFAIPSYSTPYYGTSGLDGNIKVYTHTPFIDKPLTWKKVFLDDDAPLIGYPNLANRLGIDRYNCLDDGHFADRVSYVGLMGSVFSIAANILAINYPSKPLLNLERFFVRSTEGSIIGKKDNSGPARYIFLSVLNRRFPSVADIGIPLVQNVASIDPLSDDQLINGTMPLSLLWYDIDYKSGQLAPASPSNLRTNTPSPTK